MTTGQEFTPITIPDRVWRSPVVVAMLRHRPRSAQDLIELATAHGYSQRHLSRRLYHLTGVSLEPNEISRIKTGRRAPNEIHVFDALVEAIGMPDHARMIYYGIEGTALQPQRPRTTALAAGGLPAGHGTAGTTPPRDTAAQDPLSIAEPWEITDAITQSSISWETLEQLETTVSSYVIQYPQASPDKLFTPVRNALGGVMNHLRRGQRREVHERLLRLAAVLGGLAGSLSFDLGDTTRTMPYFEAAFLATKEGGDSDLGAWVLATQSLVPYYDHDAAAALVILRRASDLAAHRSGSTRRAWLLSMAARAEACLGRGREALASLDRADAELARTDSAPTGRLGTDFFGHSRLAALRGASELLLRRSSEARSILVEALSNRDARDIKGRALIQLDIAETYLQENEIAAACRSARDALFVPAMNLVDPVMRRLASLQTEMAKWHDRPEVSDFDELVRLTMREREAVHG